MRKICTKSYIATRQKCTRPSAAVMIRQTINGPMVLALKPLASVSSANALVISLTDQYLTTRDLRYWRPNELLAAGASLAEYRQPLPDAPRP
jgi:hypothetical protein